MSDFLDDAIGVSLGSVPGSNEGSSDILSFGVAGTEGDPLLDMFPGNPGDPFFGGQAAEASRKAGALQAQSARDALELEKAGRAQAQGFFDPFAGAGARGLKESQFLANPQAQFDFLQNNPLFNLALENANQRTERRATSRGRLSAGDTFQSLSNNVLLSASPLIDRQREDATNLLQFGGDIAGSQANIAIGEATNLGGLTTDIGASLAAGEVGAANALAQGGSNALQTAGTVASFFSDTRLKTNIQKTGVKGKHKWYTWDWNRIANTLGLEGSAEGVLAQEAIKITPNAVILDGNGYYKVNYGELNGS